MKYWIISVLSAVVCGACQPSSEGNANFTLERVYPESALPGALVKIYGKELPKDEFVVRFGEVAADSIVSVSPQMMAAVVPELEAGTKVPVRVSVNRDSLYSNSLPFRSEEVPVGVPPLYWVTKRIQRGEVGPRGKVTVRPLYPTQYARGLVVDTVAQHLYWGSFFGEVYRGGLDPRSDSTLLVKLDTGLQDFVLDQRKEWLYYCTDRNIERVSLQDTTQQEVLYADRNMPSSLQLSRDENKLYWSEYDQSQVMVGNFADKQAPRELLRAEGGPGTLRGIVLDEQNNKIYLAETPYVGLSRIRVASLDDPADAQLLYDTDDGIGIHVEGLALDRRQQRLYWINNLSTVSGGPIDGDIRRAATHGNETPETIIPTISQGYIVRL